MIHDAFHKILYFPNFLPSQAELVEDFRVTFTSHLFAYNIMFSHVPSGKFIFRQTDQL